MSEGDEAALSGELWLGDEGAALALLGREQILPRTPDRLFFEAGPVLLLVAGLLSAAVIPLAPGLIITDLAIGALFLNAALAYVLVALIALQLLLERAGLVPPPPGSPLLQILLWVNLAGVAQRFAVRFCCTAREFGWRQGLLAIPRTFVSNIIAIMAGRRAVLQYVASLHGGRVRWEKTDHHGHPSIGQRAVA